MSRQTASKDDGFVSHLVSVDTTPGSCSHSPPLSSGSSSRSLEQRVSSKARESSLVMKVQSLQRDATSLSEKISGGKMAVSLVQSMLDRMLEDHSELVAAVTAVTASLEVVNQQSQGRAARHIASSHSQLGSELLLLAQHFSSLEESLRAKSGNLTTSPAPTTQKQNIEANDGCSPCLPEIYLTPSRPTHSPPSDSHSSCSTSSFPASPYTPPSFSTHESDGPHSSTSPSFSLFRLDPFTPDANSTPSIHDRSGLLQVDSGVPTHHPDPSSTVAKTRPHVAEDIVGGASNHHITQRHNRELGVGSGDVKSEKNPAVVQWLLTCRDTSGYGETGSDGDPISRWRRDWEEEGGSSSPDLLSPGGTHNIDGVGVSATPPYPPGGERVVSPTSVGSPLSPPISSPCADSGISCSNYSHHLPPATHYSSLPPSSQTHSSLSTYSQDHRSQPYPSSTITMSEIEALRSELAQLREEILNPAWGHALPQDQGNLGLGPESIPSLGSIPHSARGNHIYTAPNKSSTSFHTPTPSISRPYQSTAPRPFHLTSVTPTAHIYHSRTNGSSSTRLFSTPHDPTPREPLTWTRAVPQSRLVDQMVQTTSTFDPTPSTHSSSNVWNIESGSYTSHHYKPSTSLPHHLSLPPNFSPRLLVHTAHHPSHSPLQKLTSLSLSASSHH